MPKLQSPNYICKTKDEVIKEFGEPAVAWQLSSIEKIEKLFGTCEASDFKETKTKLIELPGFGEKGDVTKKIRMHQSLEKLLVSAFTEIKNANLGYILWDGHVWGHSFRYKKNSTTITYIKTRSEYSHLKEAMNDDDAWDSWGWAIKAAAYDAQNGKLGDLVEVRNGKKVTKKSLLSNHAFGTAIDINSGYNAFSKSARFDMNKKIIEIMARHGFRWGGYYHDYMHFEYTLDHILDVPGAGKAFFFPLDLGKGYEKSEENIEEYYKHTEVDHAGGFFPLGANTVWHGGVHIHTEHRALIKAMYDGEIIGGKLAFENEKANGDYGSHNFLIVKHTVTGKSLNAQFGAAGDASESDQNSKQEKTTVKKGDNLQALASTWNTTVDAIRKANPNLEDHYGESGGTSWYWAGDVVVRPVAVQQEPRRHPDSFDDNESKTFYSIYMHLNNEELDPKKNEKLREISWLPERIDSYTVKENVNIRKDTHFEETLIGTLKTGDTLKPVSQEKIKNKNGYDWLNVKVTSGNLKGKTGYVANSGSVADNIEAVMEIDPALLEKFESGDIVKIDHVKVCAGDVLWTVGKYGSDPVPLLHWEVFSEENLFPSFEKVEDDDQDFTMDCDKVFKLVNQNTGYWSDDDNLEADEVYSFYKEQSEKSTSLRKYACKFTPEWAVNLDVAIDNMKGRWYTWGLKEKLEPYVWWERAVSAGIDIPKKKPLWFYNPVSMLQCLGETGSEEASESSVPQSSDNIHTDWTEGYNRKITDQNKFNQYISKSTKDRSINPFVFKSLIAQESGFDPKARNNGGFAGLTQVGGAAISNAGFDIGDTKKVDGKWEFDLAGDERFDPEKSIEGGAKVLAAKMRSVDVMVFKHYTSELSDDEKLKFYLAAYNGGEGTVQKAYKACGKVNAKWEDLVEGKESSGLWGAIPESWGREAKYEEITKYVRDILRRAAQDGADAGTKPAEGAGAVLKRGNFDDVAVEKYTSRTKEKDGYVAGKRIEKLQKDLQAVGITSVGTADGDFGSKTETAVKDFQRYALKEERHKDSSSIKAEITFAGKENGIADKTTIDELALWHEKGYVIPQKPQSETPCFPLQRSDLITFRKNFGANRDGGRKHAGCDLIAKVGSEIKAVADGEVRAYYDFYWQTYAIEVDHGEYLVRYGEVQPPKNGHPYGKEAPPENVRKGLASGVNIKSKVKRGQTIGYVGQLRRKIDGVYKNHHESMVHFEMYTNSKLGTRLTDRDNKPYQRRNDLKNPTEFLESAIFA